MSYWFVGTGEFAALVLPLLAKNFEFSRVITKNPTVANRMKEQISPVEREAILLNLPLFRTARFSSDSFFIDELSKNPPEAIFVIDFGEIIKEPFLSGADCFNIHPSLLPKYRGSAPIQRALENGDEEIGVTLFRLVQKMDAGEIVAQRQENFSLAANASDVSARMAELGSELALDIKKTPLVLKQQNEAEMSFAPKISKEECRQTFDIDARTLHNSVRAFFPSPCVWVEWEGKRLKLIETFPTDERGNTGQITRLDGDGNPIIGCAVGSICLKKVQPEGKRVMTGAEWANGITRHRVLDRE